MPKPTTYQRPIPVNRNWNGRPGAPFGKAPKAPPRPAPGQGKQPRINIDLKLPMLPFPKT